MSSACPDRWPRRLVALAALALLALPCSAAERTLRVCAEPDNLPLLVHCAGGRDRTGITVALIQAILMSQARGNVKVDLEELAPVSSPAR